MNNQDKIKQKITNNNKIKQYRVSDYLGASIFKNFLEAENAINKLQYIVRRSYITTTEEREELYGQGNQDNNGNN